jgi:enoyl-CoA hydratase/carnithine racemase
MSITVNDPVVVTNKGGVCAVTISRVEKKNALTDAMYGTLVDALEAAEKDPGTRAILFRSEGPMFTSGNDLKDFAAAAMSGVGDGPRNVERFLEALATATRPIIAAVQGKAIGIGTTMLLHCDYVLVAEDAELKTPFIGLALVPEAASTLLLPARIGYARAFEMFALGESVNARDAVAWGLANRVVPNVQLNEAAEQVAQRFVELPLGAVIATKKMMRDVQAIKSQLEVEKNAFVERLQSPEAMEAFTAFMEKRKPDFSKCS